MITQDQLIQISPFIWQIPQTYRSDMRVPARIIANTHILKDLLQDQSLIQLVNITTLPGIISFAIAMPDAHVGYGFPIGGVAATSYPDGVITPGGIGYDINCGIRLLTSTVSFKEIKPRLSKLADRIFKTIPSGLGRGGLVKLSLDQLDHILAAGVPGLKKDGYVEDDDIHHIESHGALSQADPTKVSDQARNRGLDQLGTLGAGNHFIEVDRIDHIFDKDAAQAFHLSIDQIVIMTHTGSRGLGHQVAADYIKLMKTAVIKYDIDVPDRQLACAPLSSPEGQAYFAAMNAAANFAFSNRQLITWQVRRVWRRVMGHRAGSLKLLYDVAHNIAKVETHQVNQKSLQLTVHRKGATRAFPPHHSELPHDYQHIGQPVIIPGSMGTASYILVGQKASMDQSFGSSCHGAGRRLSRSQAKKTISGERLRSQLNKLGIIIYTDSVRDLPEEAPKAYKDVHNVVDVVEQSGIARKVARLKPLAVIKG